MRGISLLALLLGTVLCGCNKSKNYPTAWYVETNGNYVITVSGRRMLMAHDPISALEAKTYERSNSFVVPRITGRIEGSEIPRELGYYRYGGYIDISGTSMEMRLWADNTDDHRKEDLTWNGRYTLFKQR